MAEQTSAQVRHEKMMRQFQKINQFLQINSKKYYQEYDTINTKLEELRSELKANLHALSIDDEEKKAELEATLAIDAPNGVTCRLNTITLCLAHMINRPLFNGFIKKRIPIPDPSRYTLRQIPWEVDAVFFITNPLLIFDVLYDFLRFRARHSGFTATYISSRIARLLFRFTKFILEYDAFERLVQLTFVQSKRYDPFSRQVSSVVLSLCQDTDESLRQGTPPIFLNDLRRLYLILVRALFLLVTDGQHAPTSIKEMLNTVVPLLSLNKEALQADGIHEDFLQFHFTGPELADDFFDRFNALQQRNVEFTFEFLGHLHPLDRHFVLETIYQESKAYILSLYAELRKYYQHHGENLQPYYKSTAQTIEEIVDYQAVQDDPNVDDNLKQGMFIHETLHLDEYSAAMELDESDLDLAKIREIPLEESIEQKTIFEAFRLNEEEAEQKNFLFGLAAMPFCYLTLEFGTPYFNLFTLGDLAILNFSESERADFLHYLQATEQITADEAKVIHAQFPKVARLMNKIVNKWHLSRTAPKIHDSQKHLKFYEFEQVQKGFNEFYQIYVPEFLKLYRYKKFLLETLTEVARWLAHEQKTSIDRIAPEIVEQFIQENPVESLDSILKNTLTAGLYSKELGSVLDEPQFFRNLLLKLQQSKQKILNYEKMRFSQPPPSQQILNKETTEEGASQEEAESEVQSNFLLTPHLTRVKTFADLQGDYDELDPYLLELARMPFRFPVNQFGKINYMVFTWTDTTVLAMEGPERKMILEFLRVTRQLEPEELTILRKNMIRLIFFMQRMCQKLKPEGESNVPWGDGEHLDFHALAQGISSIEESIQKGVPPLASHKITMRLLLDCLTESERWISRKQNKALADLAPSELLNLLNNPKSFQEILMYLKDTPLGREHLQSLAITPQSIQALSERFIKEYQLNIRLLKYHEKFNR